MKSKKGTVLVVDDEEDMVRGLTHILTSAGYEVPVARTGEEALAKARDLMPDLILLDIMLPEFNGLEVKASLNKDPGTAELPVIFLSAKMSTQDKLKGFGLRAEDYVTKPFEADELVARVNAAVERHRHYEAISMKDPLTGLPNAQFFKKQLEMMFHVAKRYHRPFSLGMVDLDNLKMINDKFGHAAGDEALRKIAQLMNGTLRKTDVLVRYGGDEFVILFSECAAEQAAMAVDRFKKKIAEMVLIFPGSSEKVPLGVSVGLSAYSESVMDPMELFKDADRQMYEEKSKKKQNNR